MFKIPTFFSSTVEHRDGLMRTAVLHWNCSSQRGDKIANNVYVPISKSLSQHRIFYQRSIQDFNALQITLKEVPSILKLKLHLRLNFNHVAKHKEWNLRVLFQIQILIKPLKKYVRVPYSKRAFAKTSLESCHPEPWHYWLPLCIKS